MSYSGILKNGIFLWALFGVVLSVLSGSAGAAPVTFDVTFYGADTDHIVATGVVVIDDSKLTLGTGVSINQSAYIAGLVEAEITVVGNVYDTSLAPELYIPFIDDGVVTLGQSGLREINWTAAMSSFPLLTPGKPVLPPPVVGQRTDDGDGGGDDYTLGSDQNPSDELLTILMFSNGWVMTKDGGEASGDSSLFVERLVPEPGTILILSTGVLSLAGRRRKR